MRPLLLVAALASTLANAATDPKKLPDHIVQVNVTVLAGAPGFAFGPGLKPDRKGDQDKKNYTVRDIEINWNPPQEKQKPWGVQFADLQYSIRNGDPPPWVSFTALATDMYFLGRYNNTNTSFDAPYFLQYGDDKANTKTINQFDALATMGDRYGDRNGTNQLGKWEGMKMQENMVFVQMTPNMEGGASLAVDEVQVTSWMKLKAKRPLLWEDVNTTWVHHKELKCGETNGDGDGVQANGCSIKIPKGTAFIQIFGNMGSESEYDKGDNSIEPIPKPKKDQMVTLSGLTKDVEINTRAWYVMKNTTLHFEPLDYTKEYTLKIDGDLELSSLRYFSGITFETPWYKKVPWWIVGVSVGGAFGLLLVGGLLWRFLSMAHRRKKRDSVLELSRVNTAGSSYQPLVGNAAPPGIGATGEYKDGDVESHTMPNFQYGQPAGGGGILRQ